MRQAVCGSARPRPRWASRPAARCRSPKTTAWLLTRHAASEDAIEQLIKAAAPELKPRRITVSAVCLGATDTELSRHANSTEALAQVAVMTPLSRLGRPEHIADVVLLACRTAETEEGPGGVVGLRRAASAVLNS
ncbi:SDR family oxidoreductase [Aeromicrobium phragmitis]|uniref:SDR family oxidoreductase n=1 Tax=Aeromicrobium phragmitis TaxID=2478914 RepID=A0A3L8PLI0_9ACTN|nr:SDR family oxidoreductase [Aeromicrobium phragmitis]RLV55669.1 SDR family oxidoreductase [Aeromicrobium phragmitis]